MLLPWRMSGQQKELWNESVGGELRLKVIKRRERGGKGSEQEEKKTLCMCFIIMHLVQPTSRDGASILLLPDAAHALSNYD